MTARRHIGSGSPWEALAGYSRAVVQPMPGGSWVFVAGTLGMDDPASGRLADGAQAQTHRALDIVERALAEVPASLADTVRVVLKNHSGGAIDAASGTLRADVWKH